LSPKTTEQSAKKSRKGVVKSGPARALSPRVVKSFIVRRKGTGKKAVLAPEELVQLLRAGLPVGELDDLQASLGVPMERLAPMLGISTATLHRRRAGLLLGTQESDRVVRYARLMGRAIDVFESEANARAWLGSPQVGLGGAVPLDYAGTEVGAREVEHLLGRIEYGVYS
jgi:putative toxin-antitoxin system antitoxin component (TIGR02293 family)